MMDEIMAIAAKHNLLVIEDAAQAIDSFYKGRPLGSIGHFSAFSFHETKNVISGEGGMIVLNKEEYIRRAEIIREKGTNRTAFFRGEVDKYNWVDIGSSFLPSEITAAFLFAQLEHLENIQQKRKALWEFYYEHLFTLEQRGVIRLPVVPEYASKNGHLFYILCNSLSERTSLSEYLKKNGIFAVFHYISLHKSPFYKAHHSVKILYNSDKYTDTLLRLPLFFDLTEKEIEYISLKITEYFRA
jgi:dTDP-4-amino-4,6-dideoxygalactose transaminase